MEKGQLEQGVAQLTKAVQVLGEGPRRVCVGVCGKGVRLGFRSGFVLIFKTLPVRFLFRVC